LRGSKELLATQMERTAAWEDNHHQIQFQEQGATDTWDRVSANYDWQSYWGNDNQANLAVLASEIEGPFAGKRIIEVGCGSGFMSARLSILGANVAILDKSEAAIDVACGAFVRLGLKAPEVFVEDALDNSVPSDLYDVVWNGGVIEHFFDDGKRLLIQEMLRMAKPGGKVVIMVPNAWCIPFRIGQFWQRLKGTWKYGYEDDMSPMRIKAMCHQLGLQSVQTYSFNKVVGVAWLPRYGYRIANALGWDTLETHTKKSCLGFVTIAIIQK